MQSFRLNTCLALLVLITVICLPAFGRVYTFGQISDTQKVNDAFWAVKASMEASHVKRLVIPGDYVSGKWGNLDAMWTPWKNAGFMFEAVAIGNHHIDYQKDLLFGKSHDYYDYSPVKDVRFVVLNSDNEDTAREQAAWLQYVLGRAQEKFIFVIFRHPTYSLSYFHSWKEKRSFHLAVRPVLFSYANKITAIMNGHDHFATFVMIGSLPVILSGATTVPRNPESKDYVSDGVRIKTQWIGRKGIYWTRVDADAERNTVWLNYIDVYENKVACSIKIYPKDAMKMKSNCFRQ